MKPHCPQCKRIIELVAKAFEDLHSPDLEKACAAEVTLSMVITEKYEPLDGGKRWHAPEERRPAEGFPPAEFIRDELKARGWTARNLAHLADLPLAVVELLLRGEKEITRGIANGLAVAFGTSWEFWMNLEKAWRDWLAASPLPLSEQEGR